MSALGRVVAAFIVHVATVTLMAWPLMIGVGMGYHYRVFAHSASYGEAWALALAANSVITAWQCGEAVLEGVRKS